MNWFLCLFTLISLIRTHSTLVWVGNVGLIMEDLFSHREKKFSFI